MNYSLTIKDLIITYPDKTNQEILELALNDAEIQQKYYTNVEALKGLIRTVKSRIKRKENTEIEISSNNPSKEIQTRHYVSGQFHYFEPIKGKFKLSNEIVDDLFYSFSKHGLDLSQTQILNKYNLEPWQWHAIKNALRLYKMSHIFSPHTVETTDPEEMKVMVREKMDQNINTLGYTVEQEYNKSIIKKYKDVIRQDTKKHLEVQTILSELQDLLPRIQIQPVVNIVETTQSEDLVVVLADMHFGLDNSSQGRECSLPQYNTSVLKERLKQIAKYVNERKAKKVHILNAGDVIETFQGNNHVGSWKGLESGFYGSHLVIECYKTIVEFLSQINNLSSYSQVPGNHDRSSSSNIEDVEGFIGRIVFEFIQTTYSTSKVEMRYDELLIPNNFGGINYLLSHGDKKLSHIKPSDLILKHSPNPRQYTVLIKGHYHERQIVQDHEMFRSLTVPAIMPGNHYSVSSGYSATPGFIMIESLTNDKPLILDYSL